MAEELEALQSALQAEETDADAAEASPRKGS